MKPSSEEQLTIYPLEIKEYPLFKDVVGKPREFLEDMIENIDGSMIFSCMGTKPDKSFLLYGPPGCGKTYSISALNNELNYDFLQNFYKVVQSNEIKQKQGNDRKNYIIKRVNINDYKLRTFEYSIGKMGTAYINIGSRRVQEFFDRMFELSRLGKKTLVVLDEVDALLIDRTGGLRAHSEDHKVLETIMKNLQKVNNEPNVYVVMMTNLPEICDKASLRAGRIDKKYKFDLPDLEQRKLAFENFINQRNELADYQVIRKYNSDCLAEMTKGFNYADISATIDSALKQRAREIIRNRKHKIIPAAYITQKRLEDAILEHLENFKEKKKKMGFI